MTEFLTAMAVMKVNFDRRGGDVLNVLIPFVADCVRTSGEAVSDENVQESLKERFGLPVPRTVVKTLLRRLARAGVLERTHGVFVPVPSAIEKPEYDLTASVADVKRKQAYLLQRGVEFARRVFEVQIAEEDMGAAIAALVREEVAPLAVWAVDGSAVHLDTRAREDLQQVAAQYVLHVIENGESEERAALEQIAKGGLLSGVLWATDVEAPDRRMRDVAAYLDTTLLLRLLGVCGRVRQAFSQELIDLAQQNGMELYCFEHTRREVVGVLSAARRAVSSGRRREYYGEAVEYMVSSGWSPSDVEEVVASLEERLQDLGISIRVRPDREARYNMDEHALRGLLNDLQPYSNPDALDKDIDSLASIFILRRGRDVDRLESCRAIFVTTNNNIAVAARQLYKVGESLRGVPLALAETQVACYLWAHQPRLDSDFSLNLLAMGALSIAETDPRTWAQYVAKLRELRDRETISERDYTLLRQSLLARSLLLTVTDNDPDALTEDSTEFVLKHALAEHGRELELQLAEREREVQEGARRISEAEARELAREVTFKREADRVARRVVRTGFVAISVLCVAAAFFSFPWPVNPPFIQLLPTWAAVVLGIIALAAFIVGLAGWSFRHARRWLEMPLSRSLERRYRARFNPADDAS